LWTTENDEKATSARSYSVDRHVSFDKGDGRYGCCFYIIKRGLNNDFSLRRRQ